jgi:peptidoglycan/LPS O-acetylase OafA/YrhL
VEQRDRWYKVLGPVAAVSLVAIVTLMAQDSLPLMYMNQAVLTLPFAALIWFLAYDRGWVAKAMSVPLLVLLGEASYSLYLIHIIVKQVGFRLAGHFFQIRSDFIPLTVAVVIAAIVASVIIFKVIEKPSRRWIISQFSGRKSEVVDSSAEAIESEEPAPASVV